MLRILIQVGKKILLSSKGEVLIPYEGYLDNALKEWVSNAFYVNVIRIKENHKLNIAFVTAVAQSQQSSEKLVSIPNAIGRISENEKSVKNLLAAQQAAIHVQLQYGVRYGKIVCISEISEEQRGLKCECICPGCGMPLQARLGKLKQPHFAHNNTFCDTRSAQQTALHMLAKEIVEEDMAIFLPSVRIERCDTSFHENGNYLISQLPEVLEYRKACMVRCDSVVLEKHISDIIPDIVITVSGKPCLVEIAVTHFVDDEKACKAKAIGLPLVEIDISAFYGQPIDKDKLREVLMRERDNRYWIYNPLMDSARLWAEQEFHKAFRKAQAEAQEKERKKLEAQKRKQEKREATSKKIEQLFNAPNYKEALMELRNDRKFHSELSKFSFAGDVGGKIPFFIDIPITGEMIFYCDRRIWQGAIFDRFVYNRKSDEKSNATIHIKKIQKWLTDYQETIKINWSLASKAYVCINGRETNFSLLYDVVKKYLEYLTEIGFLSTLLYQEATVERTHSLVPPDSTGAARLQAALQSVDLYSPDIDFVIQHILHPEVSHYSHIYFSENIELQAQKENEDMKAMLLKTKLNKRKLGHDSVKLKNFYSNAPIYDDFGFRWLYCTECNMIKREDEMSSYGGVNRTNLGICRECSRRNAHDQNL